MRRILVVDDDEAFRYSTAKLLIGAGYEVTDAPDFRDALPIIEDGSPLDLFVVDAVLPGVNGFALARMARMKHRNIKCIYISAYDVPSFEAIGPVLRKPFADEALLAEVVKALPILVNTEYRVFFFNGAGGIEARHEFRAEGDAEAVVVAGVLGDACSDVCAWYELWDHGRLLFSTKSETGARRKLPSLDEITIKRQRQILDVEDTFRRSRWHIARSLKLIEATDALRQRCEPGGQKDV